MTDVLDETTETDPPAEEAEPIEGTDEDAEPDEGAPETQPDDEPEGAVSEKEIERDLGRLEKEAQRHAGRVAEIMGDDAVALVRCELCEPLIPGFRWPEVPEEDPRHMIVAFLREGGEVMPPEDDEAQRCDRCDGYGVTLTHSRVPMQDTRPCSKCGAKGWTSADERRDYDSAQQSRIVADEIAHHSTLVTSTNSNVPTVDPWGRPRGAPFFGMNPDYMTPEQTAQDWQRPKPV